MAFGGERRERGGVAARRRLWRELGEAEVQHLDETFVGHHDVARLQITVHDAGGHLIAAQRQDGASMMRVKLASGKAVGALSLGV